MLVITIAAIKTRAIPASNCFFFFEPLKLYILFTSLTKSVIIELLFRLLVHFIYDRKVVFMLPCFTVFLIFIIVLNISLRKQRRSQEEVDRKFWDRELAANNTRKQDITKLDYITIPSDMIPQNLHTDAEQELVELSSKKMLNLINQTNTDLKLKYGVANLEELSEYEENFTRYIALVPAYAQELIDAGQKESAIALLELAVAQHADSSPIYSLLAEQYIQNGNSDKVQELMEQAKSIDSISGSIIVQKLQEMSAPA